jgi:hypothetical protein
LSSNLSDDRLEQVQGGAGALGALALGAALALWWLGSEVAWAAGCGLMQAEVCTVVRQAERLSMSLAGVAILGFGLALVIQYVIDERSDDATDGVVSDD